MATFTVTQSNPKREKIYLYPEGDLSSCTEWTAHGESQNWACVDEDKDSPDYTTTYVSMASDVEVKDMYELPNAYINGTIDYVKIYTRVRTSIAPPPNLEYYMIVNSDSVCANENLSSNQDLTTGWAKKSYLWKDNPDTGTTWTSNEIDTMSIGIKGKSEAKTVEKSYTHWPSANNSIGILYEYPASTAHYLAVGDSTSNWVYEYALGASTHEDFYELPNQTTETGTISSITVFAELKGYTAEIKLRDAVPNELTSGTINLVDWTYKWKSHTFSTAPDGGAWTWAKWDALKVGIKLSISVDTSYTYCRKLYVVINMENENRTAEIDVTQCYAEVAYTPSTCTCTLNKPEIVSTNHSRNVKMINFWNGDREVYDLNRSGKSLVLKGREWGNCDTTTETFTFNTYDINEVWQFNPERMVDGTPLNFATSWTADDTQLLTSSTASDVNYSSCGNITKVEIYFVGADAQMQPIFNTTEGSMYPNAYTWYDITNDSAAPNIWSWTDVKNLDIRMHADFEAPFQAECGIVYVRVTYKHNAPCCRILCVRDMARNGATVDIAGLNPTYFNGTYHIRQFGWKKISEKPEHYEWILSLEDNEA